MKKYGWIIGILALMNIVLLGIVWFGKPPHSGGQELTKFVEQNLKFTAEQSKQYDVLIGEHRKRIQEINEQTKEAKQAFFQLIAVPADTAKEKALTEQLAKLAIEKEMVTLNHFRKVRNSICTAEQKVLLDKLIDQVLERMSPQNHPPRPPQGIGGDPQAPPPPPRF